MLNWLIDLPSLQYIGFTLFIALLSAGFSKFYFKIANGVLIQAGLIATLIGLVGMLQNMSDPQKIGPAMAVALLPIFYALIISAGNFLVSKNMILSAPEPKTTYQIGAVILWGLLLVLSTTQSSSLAPFADWSSVVFIALCLIMIFLSSRFYPDRSFALVTATYLPYAGLIGFLMGFIGVLHNINEPKSIGPAMAISILTLMYANIISIAIKLALPTINQRTDSQSWSYLGMSLLFIAVLYVILLASF